jgi:hypothetical protein
VAGENDLVQQTTSSKSEGAGATPTSPGSTPKQRKNLLQLPPEQCAKTLNQMWTDQETIMRRRRAQWRVNRLRRMGITGVQLVKQQDTHQWVVWAPPGGTFTIPTLNKADRLCRRLTSNLFADPPVPDATPARDDDEAADAAEFATRALVVVGGEGGLDNNLTARQAFDMACTYDSGFRRFYVDPTGGGTRPKSVIASPQATSEAQAITQLNGAAFPPPYVTRYVKADGSLTDDPAEADIAWVPKLKCDVISGKQVRMLPATARDIWCADGVLVGSLIPLGQLRAQFPEKFKTLDDAAIRKMIAERPEQYEDLLPVGIRPSDRVVAGADPKDDSLVFTLSCYYKQIAGQYDRGAYVIVAGGVLLHRDVWYDTKHNKPLDIPLDQFKAWDDEDDPYGKGPMRLLGPGNEVRAAQIGALLEHLDRFNNRKVFYPLASALVPKAMQAATGTYIPINSGGQPVFEDIPTFPDSSLKMLDFMTGEMDDESGLQQTAQGLAAPSVQSGLHAQRIIEQVLIGLSDIKENSARALRRGWRIQLQLMRAHFKDAQELRYRGDDGLYKLLHFTAAELGDTSDVDIQQGSFTMLTPSAKVAVAEHLAAMQVVGPDGRPQGILSALDLRHQALTAVGGTIGLQDDPSRQRIRRQIDQWVAGPPKLWRPALPPMPAIAGQPAPPAPPDPVLAAIFDPNPADDEPAVAQMRHWELQRTLCSTRFSRHPKPWQAGILAEYQRARRAASIMTVAEQAQAQQSAQNAEARKVSIALSGQLTPDQASAAAASVGLPLPKPAIGTPGGTPPALHPQHVAPSPGSLEDLKGAASVTTKGATVPEAAPRDLAGTPE